VIAECLQLTTWFGERDRAGRRPLADELLRIYGDQRVMASVLLRGAEGFGRHHRLRTDRLLTLSEDLPVVSVAIDGRERIEALLPRVLAVKRRGLVTLERALLLRGEVETAQLPAELGQGCKLTVYVGRHRRVDRAPAYVAITELLHRRGVAGASVLLGVDGTRDGERFRAGFLARNLDVPAIVVAVGDGDRIAQTLPELGHLLPGLLITLERVRICKRDGALLCAPPQLPQTDEHGRQLHQKLTVYASQSATHDGHPLGVEIVRRLRASHATGATSLRGVWGFHGEHAPHGDRLLQLRRRVPVLTVAIDTPQQTAESFAIVDELTAREGLVTCEAVPALHAPGSTDGSGGGAEISLANVRACQPQTRSSSA
jgi:PII-like signaling protein